MTKSIILLALLILFKDASALAQNAPEFYSGKQLRMYIRAAPGGNYDLYGRLILRHIAAALPGSPTPVPVNMPGGSGMSALNYAVEAAPQDGTTLTLVTPSFPMDQALGTNKALRADMGALNWIGNLSTANSYLLTRQESATASLEDARNRETVIGVPSTSDITAWLTVLLNKTADTKFRLVSGYSSGPEMNLAMQRGEIEGRGTTNPEALLIGAAPGTRFNLLVQMGIAKDPAHPDVPLLTDLATTADQKVAFGFLSKVAAISRPLATTRSVPRERVAQLRQAFDKAVRDPEFLQEAQRLGLELSPLAGVDVQGIVSEIVGTRKEDVQTILHLLGPSATERKD